MQCSACKREMVQLFLSQACDHCDFGVPKERLHRGFVVYRKPADNQSQYEDYVFRTRMDAERWQRAAGYEGRPDVTIREVYSLMPYRWHLSRGTLRDVVLADMMFEVFPDHKYEPLPHRCFLSQDETSEPEREGVELNP